MNSDGTDPFRVGGSMWIWDTYDPGDDAGVLHLYYAMDQGFAGPSNARSGNGLTGAEKGGEGWIYRRLRQ